MAWGLMENNRPDPSKRTSDEQLIADVVEAMQDAWEHERNNRREAAIDLRFLAGDQWPETVRQEREQENRPMLTINRLPQFVRQITNDIRQADLAIKASPVGEDDTDLTKIYNGLFRQIHYRSSAQHVFSTAAEHQASCGIGWFRINTDYVDDASFDQEIRFEAIQNPMSVYCDPAAVLPDRSDASWIAVTELMPKSAFEAAYSKSKAESIQAPAEDGDSWLFWNTGDQVRVCEYWHKKPVKQEIGILSTGEVVDLTDMPKEQRVFLEIEKTRVVDSFEVESYIMTGSEVLSGPHKWPGKHIPIIPVVGGEFPLEKQTYRYGAIRFARDPQQLYNYYRTASAEHIALSPKAPYIVTSKMIKPYKRMWDTANKKNRPYLVYDTDKDAPTQKPQRESAPEPPVALTQELQIASEDMKATTGIYDAGLGARSNETSGKAIMARDQQGDVANYHFIDNLKRSLEHAGRILIDLVPKIYDNERVIRLIGEDDSEESVPINRVMYADDGEPVVMNDLSVGRFDVRVTIGKAYTTKRMEQADSMMQFLQAFPAAAELAGDLFAKAFDWPGADELSKRLRAAVPPEIIEAAEVDENAPPPPPEPPPEPDPMQVAMAEAEIAEKQTTAQKNEAMARKAMAEAERTEFETQFAGGFPEPPPDAY